MRKKEKVKGRKRPGTELLAKIDPNKTKKSKQFEQMNTLSNLLVI